MSARTVGPASRFSAFVILTFVSASIWAQDLPSGRDDTDRERQVVQRFLTLLEQNPKKGTALDRIYGYHVERGTLDTFLEVYHDRIRKDPKDGAAWLILGLVEAQRGRDAASVAALRKATETRSNDPLPSYYLGQALVLVGQPEAAAQAFEQAIARKPSRSDLLEIFQALGRVFQRAHRTEEALKVWNRLERLFPDDLRVQEQIAEALAEEAQPDQALPRYQALARMAADPYRKVQFRIEAAELEVRLGNTDRALAEFESLLGQLNPDSWLHREVRRKIEEVFLRNDDLAGLAAYYEDWLKKRTDDVDAMARLGRSLAMQGRVAEARSWLDKAVRQAPSRKELRLALVEQLVQEKKFSEAAVQYEAMVRSDPNNPDLVRDWGRLLLRDTGRPLPERKKAAAAVWRKMVETRPQDPAVATQAADLFRQAEMADDAIALYLKAIALAPDQPQYREYLGEYYHALKRSQDALAAWAEIAAGPNRNAKNLARLSEVYAGFGYVAEALGPVAEACRLAPEDFDLRMKYAGLLARREAYAESLQQLDAAEPLADDNEQRDAVLDARVKSLVAAGRLAAETDALRRELSEARSTAAGHWLHLARYLEAAGIWAEATRAVQKAVAIDPKSVAAWDAAARIHEASGNLGASADAQRTLADLDRRGRADHLAAVARLEARLGRKEAALEAGRARVAAAPGNPESHQFFADLCFQLGEVDEGFEAMRRAARVSPDDAKATLALAEMLAARFRTDEAIELFWRALDKQADLEGKVDIVSRLTKLYLQRNQFDRLVGRLERKQREPNAQREMTFCLAQAYAASEDYGAARQTLEGLLTSESKDVTLLAHLSALAESEGDLATAAKYQKRMTEVAPSPEAADRLAQLYVRLGETTQAEGLWTSLANDDREPRRILDSLDSLLDHGKEDTVLAITERLLRKDPGDWDALYREAVAFARQDKKDEAAQRFRAVLSLRVHDDTPSVAARASKPGVRAITSVRPLPSRLGTVDEVRAAAGLEQASWAMGQAPRRTWRPGDFGQARMAALAWLYRFARDAERDDVFLKPYRDARAQVHDARTAWDDYDLQRVRQNPKETYEAARALANLDRNDPLAQYVYLTALEGRAGSTRGHNVEDEDTPSKAPEVPPLPAEELDRVLVSLETLRTRQSEWADRGVISQVSRELARAGRESEREALYRKTIATAMSASNVNSALDLAAERGDAGACLALFDKSEQQRLSNPNPFGTGAAEPLARAMSVSAAAKDHAGVLRILDHVLNARRPQKSTAGAAVPVPSLALMAPGMAGSASRVWVAGRQRWANFDFPEPNAHFDHDALLLLREAYELFDHDDLFTDLLDHFRTKAKENKPSDLVRPHLALGYLEWWHGDRDQAVEDLARATEAAGNDVELRFELASLRAQRGELAEALALVDAIEPLDNATMERRELLGLRLAVLTGDVARARKAAERLFHLRLDTNTQIQLAGQMHQLGMHALAEAVLTRARHRAGNNVPALQRLMSQLAGQNQMDQAVQVAHQILRRMPNASFVQAGSPFQQDEAGAARQEALQVLAQSGRLKELIGRAEAQVQAAPGNPALLEGLAAYYQAAGDAEKTRALYERLAKLRTDDARLRYRVAMQLVAAGDPAAALEHFRAAILKEPSVLAMGFEGVQQIFEQQGKGDEFVTLLEKIDLKSLGNSWTVARLVSSLLEDDRGRARGLTLLRHAWKAYPDDRAELIQGIGDDVGRQIPELYDYLRDLVVPAARENSAPWAGFETIISMGPEGIDSGMGRLLGLATLQNRLGSLERDVRRALDSAPGWTGGRALLGLIRAREGKLDEAATILAGVRAEIPKSPVPLYAGWVFGQQLEEYETFRGFAEEVYKRALEDKGVGVPFEFSNSPAARLVHLYKESGRRDEARSLVLSYAKRRETGFSGYGLSRTDSDAVQALSAAGELTALGFPADGLKLYGKALGELSSSAEVRGWANQAEQGLQQALLGLKGESLAAAVHTFTEPVDLPKGQTGPALDLALTLLAKPPGQAPLPRSFFAEVLEAATQQPALLSEASEALARTHAKHPEDLAIAIGVALAAFARSDAGAIESSVARVAAVMDRSPLEPLGPGERANARQRAAAARQLGLWLVARACWKRAETRPRASAFAERALEAAGRQAQTQWALAMLREWGQAALDAGDRAGAEARWGRMFELIVKPPAAARKPIPADAGPSAPELGPRAMPLTLDRFQQAAELAQLAARHEMPRLSVRALGLALAPGPPVAAVNEGEDFTVSTGRSQGGSVTASVGEVQNDQTPMYVAQAVAEIVRSWRPIGVSSAEKAAVLRAAVLPEARPTEIFLYPYPSPWNDPRDPRSLGQLLARVSVEAGQASGLREQIEARRAQPLAELPAEVLLGLLAEAEGDAPAAVATLEALTRRLESDKLLTSCMLAGGVALPALNTPATAAAGASLLERTITNLRVNPEGTFICIAYEDRLVRYHLERNDVPAALALVKEGTGPRTGTPENADFTRARRAGAARAFLRAGLLEPALEQLGALADTPDSNGGERIAAVDLLAAFRLLSARPAAERYALLKAWCLPSAHRNAARLVVTLVPDDRIPAEFGVRPMARHSDSLDPRGILSTANLLIDAAREAGRLDELAVEIRKAAESKIENARLFHILVEIARGQGAAVAPVVVKVRDALANEKPQESAEASFQASAMMRLRMMNSPQFFRQWIVQRGQLQGAPPAWGDYLVAHACLADPALAPNARPILRRLYLRAAGSGEAVLAQHLFRALIDLERSEAGGAALGPDGDPGLVLWRPSAASSRGSESSACPAWWVAQGGTIGHVAGAGSALMFAWPLTGTFTFTLDAFPNGGQPLYGRSPLGADGLPDAINHWVVQVEPGKVRYQLNGRQVLEDKEPSRLFPWLSLQVNEGQHAVFSNLKLTGQPTVPRRVALIDGDRLDGWATPLGEQVPTLLNSSMPIEISLEGVTAASDQEFDWRVRDGVLTGRRTDDVSALEPTQSWLEYSRPMVDGDVIEYEFFYEPGAVAVQPALGRLAFLLEPSGVRLHWITHGPEAEPSGLEVANVADEPACRRGIGPLPLKVKDWNRVALNVTDDAVRLSLNGRTIYVRPMDPNDGRTFGLFHFKDRTEARVRAATLSGRWPESLSTDQLANLAARRDGAGTPSERTARQAVFGERAFAAEAADVLATTRSLPAAERFAALASWVLPGPDRPTFRLFGEFSPANAASPVASTSAEVRGARVWQGGRLRAPAIELIQAAREAGQLDELGERIAATPARRPRDVRARLALLAMVQTARGRDDEALATLRELGPLLGQLAVEDTVVLRWPELVAATALAQHEKLRPVLASLLETMVGQTDKMTMPDERWGLHVRHARARLAWMERPEAKDQPFGTPPHATLWTPVVLGRASTRGLGLPSAHWTVSDSAAIHAPGHDDDRLDFRIPLRGDFEVVCELSSGKGREARLGYGGTTFGIATSNDKLEVEPLGGSPTVVRLPKPVAAAEWYEVRLAVQDGTLTVSVEGTKVHEQGLPAEPDPWLSVHVPAKSQGGARRLTVRGQPEVPEALNLTRSPDLAGWTAGYFDESTAGDGQAWRRRGDEIYATGGTAPDGTMIDALAPHMYLRQFGGQDTTETAESVLQYRHPLLEDGAIEYEFYYDPEKAVVHPALDRLTFILDPDGVKIHWMTDGPHDRTGMRPENLSVEPAVRRGPDQLPLQPKRWNSLRIALKGDRVTLTLNGVEICERVLEPTNQRIFGLFHFANKSEVRVRKLVYQGAWPGSLPTTHELAPHTP
jgi:tetratricopeptide (TPR) repeat protein